MNSDADSIDIQFTQTLGTNGNVIPFLGGNTVPSPFGTQAGVNLNANNGIIQFLPTAGLQQRAVVSVLIEEWKDDGTGNMILASLIRDIVIIVFPTFCINDNIRSRCKCS